MFCSQCGLKSVVDAKYCHACGSKCENNPSSSSASTTCTSGLSSVGNFPTYENFRLRKEVDRSKHFKKKQKLSDQGMQDVHVTIQIGFMIAKDGDLVIKRGSYLPLKVKPSIRASELLQMAVEKQSRFNKDMMKDPIGYKILYSDKREVENIPGKEVPFVLQTYKEDIGKPFTRICFFLCTQIDYLDYISCSARYSDSDDSEEGSDVKKNVLASAKTSEHTGRICTITSNSMTNDGLKTQQSAFASVPLTGKPTSSIDLTDETLTDIKTNLVRNHDYKLVYLM